MLQEGYGPLCESLHKKRHYVPILLDSNRHFITSLCTIPIPFVTFFQFTFSFSHKSISFFHKYLLWRWIYSRCLGWYVVAFGILACHLIAIVNVVLILNTIHVGDVIQSHHAGEHGHNHLGFNFSDVFW